MQEVAQRLRFIIGHQRPSFNIWDGWKFVTFEARSDSDFILEPEWKSNDELTDTLLGEYYFLFCLSKELKKRAIVCQRITISQYRRFVSNKVFGNVALNQSWTRTITPELAEVLNINSLVEHPGSDFLISTIGSCDSILNQFSDHHSMRDILRFASDLVDADVLNNEQVKEMIFQNCFIPAPSNGTFPLATFLEINRKLEEATNVFFRNGYVPRGGYQRRVIGFCLERLNSYLLMKELQDHGVNPLSVMGQQITVSENDSVTVTV